MSSELFWAMWGPPSVRWLLLCFFFKQVTKQFFFHFSGYCHVILTIDASSSPLLDMLLKNELQLGQDVETLVQHVTSEAAVKWFYGAEREKSWCPSIIKRDKKIFLNTRSKDRQTIVTATFLLPDGRRNDVDLSKCSIMVISCQALPQPILLLHLQI